MKTSTAATKKYEDKYTADKKTQATLEEYRQEAVRLGFHIENMQKKLLQVQQDYKVANNAHCALDNQRELRELERMHIEAEEAVKIASRLAAELLAKFEHVSTELSNASNRWKFKTADDILVKVNIPRDYEWLKENLKGEDFRLIRSLMKKRGFPPAQAFDLAKQKEEEDDDKENTSWYDDCLAVPEDESPKSEDSTSQSFKFKHVGDEVGGVDDTLFSPEQKKGKVLVLPTVETSRFNREEVQGWEDLIMSYQASTAAAQKEYSRVSKIEVTKVKASTAATKKYEKKYTADKKTQAILEEYRQEAVRLGFHIENMQKKLLQVQQDYKVANNAHCAPENQDVCDTLEIPISEEDDDDKENTSWYDEFLAVLKDESPKSEDSTSKSFKF
ncbi:unnamed protein product [Cylindrotheca closterium]|uniref:Uncharacterized protein n=1 Tax=Cylindrotheca closterium TaxID=2856 RepID=A0AAD2CQW3_9STRA|nr:unnamed protein product [Cylindrotheca closterium]